MTKEQIKQTKGKATKAFRNNNYSTGFNLLRKLSIEDFFKYSKRNNLFNKVRAVNYFCTKFITDNTNFKYVFDSDFGIDALEIYYDTKNKKPNLDLEKRIAQEYPELFVKAIRVNQVFFNPNRIDFLVHEIQLPEPLKIHQKVWKLFQGHELDLWDSIETSFKQLSQYPIIDILHAVILYLERENFKDSSDKNQQSLGDCYSSFISYFLVSRKEEIKTIQQSDTPQSFVKSLKKLDTQLINTITNLFKLIKYREGFDKSHWKPYSFEKGIQTKELYHTICFSYQPKEHYQWQRDGNRYIINEMLYFRPVILNGYSLKLKPNCIKTALKDLGIKVFYNTDLKYNQEKEINLGPIITPLYEMASHYYYYYDNVMKHDILKSSDWLESYSTYQEFYPSPKLPFILENQKNIFNNDEKLTKDILTIYGYRNKHNHYNRFKNTYSVFRNPFVQLGDFIFYPTFLFVSFTGIYNYIAPLLKNNNIENRNSAKNIEAILIKHLQSEHWCIKQLDEKIQKKGDSDVILYNDTTVLLLQVKRTSLRLDSKAAYLEIIQNDQKAIQQLNDSEAFLKSKDTPFDLENRKVVKWIVSTSFEGVNQITDGCRKMSYFEIIQASRLYDDFDTLTLEKFIDFFEKDSFIIGNMHDTDISLSIDEVSSYNLEYIISNTSYNDNYNKALDLNREQKNHESIQLFKECLKKEKNDVLVHSCIANVYADMYDYTNAFKHFKKALTLSKKDPFITRNYISVLAESGNFEEAKKVADLIFSEYPMLKQEIYDHLHGNINFIQLMSTL